MQLVAIVSEEVRLAALYDRLKTEGFNDSDIHISELDDRDNFRELDQNIDYQQFDDNSFMMGFKVPDNKVDRIKDLFEKEGVREVYLH
ncbi:hypothetical protein [Candidatus Contubernalis alkaliaceticus]|uniref:hypothetical protein n=1 Tax=Candidatus Contubernalis alkaliaceticus TaxID=338645 RepID=UPI001F4C4A0B|nr:hypothetical protein [Candidatus Contubernalis alkalaceticus]UNC93122.1 hypothetical protein HUE98_14110 [Candidatus Contubernalis alkalaceticus]